jgi:hypothetical protein
MDACAQAAAPHMKSRPTPRDESASTPGAGTKAGPKLPAPTLRHPGVPVLADLATSFFLAGDTEPGLATNKAFRLWNVCLGALSSQCAESSLITPDNVNALARLATRFKAFLRYRLDNQYDCWRQIGESWPPEDIATLADKEFLRMKKEGFNERAWRNLTRHYLYWWENAKRESKRHAGQVGYQAMIRARQAGAPTKNRRGA